MKKFVGFLFILGVAFLAWTLFSDPERRNDILETIEDSTGVDLEKEADKAGREIEKSWDRLTEEIEGYLKDPQFRRSLDKWGQDALESLSPDELDRLRKDLKREWRKSDRDFDNLLEDYLGDPGRSS
jgi:hypothetical protein